MAIKTEELQTNGDSLQIHPAAPFGAFLIKHAETKFGLGEGATVEVGANGAYAVHMGALNTELHAQSHFLGVPARIVLNGLGGAALYGAVGAYARNHVAFFQVGMHIDKAGPYLAAIQIELRDALRSGVSAVYRGDSAVIN